ncbi:hypothetical protein RUMGNA_03946 [Mediterraneibacter gnavus ATCC 29149]|uniref:Uncharacterized protein n=1 Tax=Mediterraneibacter gnavus (strain ATCC 29149 / DSM 114966 / JCM 6515 / VPI C7-9) TaxID=411470 RepID=A7B8M3_MEDG7|nr:hypothetical protein RUMGNA_03946 [Mediterraneibacter gnavus ATCC 29149]
MILIIGEFIHIQDSCDYQKILVKYQQANTLGVRGFVRICIETCARGYFGAWKYRFRKKGMLIRQMMFICQK